MSFDTSHISVTYFSCCYVHKSDKPATMISRSIQKYNIWSFNCFYYLFTVMSFQGHVNCKVKVYVDQLLASFTFTLFKRTYILPFNLRKLEEQFKTHSFSMGVEKILNHYDLKPDGCATAWKKIIAFTRHLKHNVCFFFVFFGHN